MEQMIQFHRILTLATIGAVLCLFSEQARSAEKEKTPAPALVKKRESAVALAEAGKAREAEAAFRAVVTEAEQMQVLLGEQQERTELLILVVEVLVLEKVMVLRLEQVVLE